MFIVNLDADSKQEESFASWQLDTVQKSSDVSREYQDKDLPVLYEKLIQHSSKWRDIGMFLGFSPGELDDIQERPPLYGTAPKSWLRAMLTEWLQWAPRDGRGSANVANEHNLKQALIKAGLSDTAQAISTS